MLIRGKRNPRNPPSCATILLLLSRGILVSKNESINFLSHISCFICFLGRGYFEFKNFFHIRPMPFMSLLLSIATMALFCCAFLLSLPNSLASIIECNSALVACNAPLVSFFFLSLLLLSPSSGLSWLHSLTVTTSFSLRNSFPI